MDGLLTSPYLILFARLTLGGVLLLGALGKIGDAAEAAAPFAGRAWLPPVLARLGARGLPWLEALVGALLLLGAFLQPAAFVAALLLFVFTAVVVADLRQGQRTACHCFGRIAEESLSPVTVGRNVVLLALAALVAWQPVPYLALDALGGGTAGLPSAVNAVPVFFLAVITVLVVVLGGGLLATIRGFLRAF